MGWFALGLLMGAFGIILVALLPPVVEDNGTTVSSRDWRKWQALKKYDPQIAEVAKRVSALHPDLERELAEGFLLLGDKSYLGAIEGHLGEKFQGGRLRRGDAISEPRLELVASSLRKVDTPPLKGPSLAYKD